ncbi:MAG: TIGR02147 family protein, partial [Pseudomonadota bacterium]
YEFLKKTTEYFSFRYFSKKAGFKSPNYLKLVIEGQRNISDESIDRFCQALKLNKQESDFFARLVQFNQAPTTQERAECALRIVESRIYQKLNPLSKEQMHYYQRWYQIGIREMALCQPLKPDAHWIAQKFRPQLKVNEAQKAMDSLVALKMLVMDEDGLLHPSTQNIWSSNEVISSFVVDYHKEMMNRAKDSIDLAKSHEREISSICVPVSEETFLQMKQKIQDFKKELMALASQDSGPDQVYQLNFQLFPLTEKLESQ